MVHQGRLKRVAFVTDFYPEVHAKWSGAEIACQRLRTLLTEKGVCVNVFTSKADFPEKAPPFVEEVRLLEETSALLGSSLKTFFPFDVSGYRFFLKRFSEFSPDVVHLHNLKFMSFAPLMAARKLGIPAVFSVYDNWALCPRYCLVDKRGNVCERFHGLRCVGCVPMKKKPFVALRRQVFGSFIKKLDAIAVLTGSEQERYLKSGVAKERIHVLPLPLFMDGEEEKPIDATVEAGTILFVGRLEHGKGLHVLVEAMPDVLKGFKGAKVLVVGEHSGSDRYKRQVQTRIAELGMGSVFSFTGKMGNAEIKELLRRSHVVVAPEQWAIAWPIFLTEAMSMGRHIVASRIGDIPEFIRDGVTGYLAAPGCHSDFADRITAALKAKRPVNPEAARVIRKLCDNRAITQKLLSIYESALTPLS
ncbi:MAG: glycosyltransferase [Deltaproteobacteria bacterium]|nr:glycosyltransferase [Deltaproteobacteria bacterium]